MTLNLDFLSQYFTEVHFDKDTLITCAGDVEHSLYYLSEGIVRFFYYNPTTDKENYRRYPLCRAVFLCRMPRL